MQGWRWREGRYQAVLHVEAANRRAEPGNTRGQGNNQFLGSPVNRVKITGMWASRALAENKNATFGQQWKEYGRHLLFRTVLITTDFVFYWSKLKQLFGFGKGMDDDIEESMRKMASRYVDS